MNKVKLLSIILILMLASTLLVGCLNTCDDCDKFFIGSAYQKMFVPNSTMCKSCAQSYYGPLPIENFKK